MVGIICALDEELKFFLSQSEGIRPFQFCNWNFFIGTLGGKRVVLCKCGVGKVNAASCAQTMILLWSIKLIVSSGVAGALDPTLKVGDVCIASKTVQYDVDTTCFGEPKGWVTPPGQIYIKCSEWAVEAIAYFAKDFDSFQTVVGVIATGDKFVQDLSEKERIAQEFSAIAVEMESGAIAHVCRLNCIDFLVVRSISDTLSQTSEYYSENLCRAAETSSKLVIEFLSKLVLHDVY